MRSKERLVDRIGSFTTIPNSFLKDKRLSPFARTLFVFLRFHLNSKSETAFPGYETLKTDTGMTRRRIAEGLAELESTGWVVKHKRFAQTTEYEMVIPKPALSLNADTKADAPLSRTIETDCSLTGDTTPLSDQQDRSNKTERGKVKQSHKPAVYAAKEPEPEPPFTGGEFTEAFASFERYLREIKKPLGLTRRKAIYGQMGVWGESKSTERLLEAITRGWMGPVAPKEQNGNGKHGSQFETASERNVRLIRETLMLGQTGGLPASGPDDDHQNTALLLAAGFEPR